MANLDIWNKLGRTDPEHTKQFNRAGGFRGTAVKPVYTEQKMTEVFGPCGIGWGVTEPTFQLVPGSDGQTAVYCWLTIWYVQDGKRSESVPGVGGDMVIVEQSSGLRTDDEAFKKAFTDAIGNAMKHLGMSADVHMGRFDDSKYVRELREELRAEDTPPVAAPEPKPAPAADPKAEKLSEMLIVSLRHAQRLEDLEAWPHDRETDKQINALPEALRNKVRRAYASHLIELKQKEPA